VKPIQKISQEPEPQLSEIKKSLLMRKLVENEEKSSGSSDS